MFSHFAETYADEYAASLSAQTNQDTLKRFYYASWNKLNNTSKEEVLHRAIKTDTEVLREAIMVKDDFLHRTFLIDNMQLLHSFLWKHMGSVVSKIIESPELFENIVHKKAKHWCQKLLVFSLPMQKISGTKTGLPLLHLQNEFCSLTRMLLSVL